MTRTLAAAAVLLWTGAASARTHVVHAGQSIRAAIEAAAPGDRVLVLPGVYHEGAYGDLNALTITRGGIELLGRPAPGRPVVLENAGGQSFGIWVSPADSAGPGPQADPEHPPCGLAGEALQGFTLRGFTIRGFGVHGVHLACVDGFWMEGNVADGNQVYGLFPLASRHGAMVDNEALNTPLDAAIYVGQSEDVLVAGNKVHDSLLGIEVENSSRCRVVGNEVRHNTFGIFVDILPFLERKTQTDTLVALNHVQDNTRANSAEAGDILAAIPAGIGILVVGADTTTVTGNRVTGNPFSGVTVVNLCLGLALQGQACNVDVDPISDGTRVVGNAVRGNGTVPIGVPELDALRADLSWDGTGTGNCWSRNAFDTSVPAPLPACTEP
jgi:parallel beta-helix repeat protein